MRPRFSVEKVGIDAGGIAPEVFALPADCPPSRMLMSSIIAAVKKTVFVVCVVMVASLRIAVLKPTPLVTYLQWRVIPDLRPYSRCAWSGSKPVRMIERKLLKRRATLRQAAFIRRE